jgi:hypothetical protein
VPRLLAIAGSQILSSFRGRVPARRKHGMMCHCLPRSGDRGDDVIAWGSRIAACAVAAGCLAAVPPAAGSAAALPGAAGPAVARAAAAKDPQKGVAAWTFGGVDKALARSGASWYYTWAPGHPGISTPRGTGFVPMIRAASNVTRATLAQVRTEGRYLLGFNEPDNAGQANMTVSQALSLWPRLMHTGMQLSSPAVASGAATPGGWLDQFMAGAKSRNYRVNFIAVHWYGGDFATGAAVAQLKQYLQAIYARYHLPIWLTEFALIRFGATATFPSARGQAAFLSAATRMLRRLGYVQRYAWFALPATPGSTGDGTAGLFRPGAVPTAAGRAFEAVP